MKKRIITLLFLVLFSAPLIYFGGYFSVVFTSIICFGGISEILINTRKKKNLNILIYVLTYLSSALLLYWNFIVSLIKGLPIFDQASFVNESFVIVILCITLLSLLVSVISKKITLKDFYNFYVPCIVITLGCIGLNYIRLVIGLNAFLYLLVVTCVCDSAAHIIGSKFGKTKLAPDLSPNKSVEGAIGGVAIATTLGYIMYVCLPFIDLENNISEVIIGIALSLLLSISGAIGDLFFSKIKRNLDIKDYSNLLPGHGGILDRFDSLLVNGIVMSTVYLFICLLN